MRKVNEIMEKQHFPSPLIEDVIDDLAEAEVFTVLNLKDEYFHVPVEEGSRRYLAFVTSKGQWEFQVPPFGFCNSPSAFAANVQAIFGPLVRAGKIRIIVDDIIILALTYEEVLKRFGEVLEVASAHGLDIKWSKSQILVRRVDYVGYVVEAGVIRPSPGKVADFMNFVELSNVKQLLRFLGLASYFRKFIKDFALEAKPLTDLTQKDVPWVWSPLQCAAFRAIIERLASDPVLEIYQQERETQLHTDASKDGYGAILMQKNPVDGHFHPTYYMSRKTTPAESRYCSYELEVLAIVMALKKFRVYLLGVPFKIVTDCAAFRLTLLKKDICLRVARWVLWMEEFSYEIQHRPGT